MNTTTNTVLQNRLKPSTPTQFLSDSNIAKRYGVSRQTVWRWATNDETFPRPIKLSPGCTRWKLPEIEAWEAAK